MHKARHQHRLIDHAANTAGAYRKHVPWCAQRWCCACEQQHWPPPHHQKQDASLRHHSNFMLISTGVPCVRGGLASAQLPVQHSNGSNTGHSLDKRGKHLARNRVTMTTGITAAIALLIYIHVTNLEIIVSNSNLQATISKAGANLRKTHRNSISERTPLSLSYTAFKTRAERL